MKNLQEFLTELTMLTKKYNISISGCGCCDSPFLYKETEHEGKMYTVVEASGGYLTYETKQQ